MRDRPCGVGAEKRSKEEHALQAGSVTVSNVLTVKESGQFVETVTVGLNRFHISNANRCGAEEILLEDTSIHAGFRSTDGKFGVIVPRAKAGEESVFYFGFFNAYFLVIANFNTLGRSCIITRRNDGVTIFY